MRLAFTPSGLTMDRVRSSAIRLDLIEDLQMGAGVRSGMRCRCAGKPRSLPWVTHPRQFGVRWKCRFGKGFCAPSRSGFLRCRRGACAALEAASDGEALPAAAFALDVRVSEAEGLVQALFDEVHDRAVEQAQACPVNGHPHPAIFDLGIPRLRAVGVVDYVGKAGAAGLTHTEPQADAVPACREEALDPICSGFRQ